MRKSSWMPSIVVNNVGGLGRIWPKVEAKHADSEKRRPMAGPGRTIPFQRKQPAAIVAFEPALMERAEIAAKQMRYFGLVARKSSFSELVPSAKRAGFALLHENAERKEAVLHWATGEPDLIFSVSFEHPTKVSVVAESCGDIFGLALLSYSHVPSISVETKPSLGSQELGRNARRFRDILLTLPDFDDVPAWTKY